MTGQILGWTIDTWSAVGSVVGGVGGSAAFVALAIDARGRGRARRLAPPEVIPLLLSLRMDLNDVVASGGTPPQWFMEPDRQKRGTELGAWHMMVNDKKLRQHLADARSAHDDAFTWSTSSYSARAIQEQTDAARGGVSAIDGALTRIGELSRKYG